MLEYAISFFGLILLIYVVLKVWVWLTGMIVLRQASFQETRLDAGQMGTAGMFVPYEREKLRLIGEEDEEAD